VTYSVERVERFKWPVSVSRTIDASPQSIWLAISRPGNLEDCHPFCESNPVYEWPGVGSRDAVYYHSGWVLHREFINWVAGVGYDLLIGREGGRNSYVSWRIGADQENTATLSITIYPHTLQHIPAAIRWLPHIMYIQPALSSYLKSVVKGFEWFITTGNPVARDQFGSHQWFSGTDA
jgi:hypothetical protein